MLPFKIKAIFLICIACLIGFAPHISYAQCRQGSGPDQGDGIPWCNAPPPASAPSAPQSPVPPPSWQSFSAAVAWADSEDGTKYVTVEKHFDADSAKEAVLAKCRSNPGWENCEIATWVTNGAIAIGRDNLRNVRTRNDVSKKAAKANLLAKCKDAGVQCKVEIVLDAMPEYY
jgi:Domain of unknown function (DUF4189)